MLATGLMSQTTSRWMSIPKTSSGSIKNSPISGKHLDDLRFKFDYQPIPTQSISRIIKRKFKETYQKEEVATESEDKIDISKATILLEKLRLEAEAGTIEIATNSNRIGVATAPESLF
jgi:hypothetical protein